MPPLRQAHPCKPGALNLRPGDVLIEIMFCGICYTDLPMTRNDWGGARSPLVHGHEIVAAGQICGRSARLRAAKDGLRRSTLGNVGIGTFEGR